MPTTRCPKCSYSRHWRLRRGKRKCQSCRAEFSIRRSAPGFRLPATRLRVAALAFVIHGTVRRVAEAIAGSTVTAQKCCHAFRLAMSGDLPSGFHGPSEVDETYIGGQRKNRRLHIRKRYPPKRGHGTQKTPIIGALDRETRRVRIEVMARKLDKGIVLDFVTRTVVRGTRIYTDGFTYYRQLNGLGYLHESVDHNAGEYVRGDAHTNGIEGFWGYMKRHMGTTGGMKRERLGLFAQELAWRYNHRHLKDQEKADLLVGLLMKIGGTK